MLMLNWLTVSLYQLVLCLVWQEKHSMILELDEVVDISTQKVIVLRSGKTDPFFSPFMHITIRTNIRHPFIYCTFITKFYGLNEINIDTKYCTIISYFDNNVIPLKLSFRYFGLFYNSRSLWYRQSEMNDCLLHKLPSC